TEEADEEIDLDVTPDDEMATQIELALVSNFYQDVFQFRSHEKCSTSILETTKGLEQLKDLAFDTVDLWVKIYSIPFLKRIRSIASIIGNKIGHFLEYDDSDTSRWAKYMRIRVRINVHNPLPRGTTMKMGGKRLWLDFRIERLPGFCYTCSCLGHGLRQCDEFDEETPESELPYGSWIRASPVKQKARMGIQDCEVENKLFQELRGSNSFKKCLKFIHCNPLSQLEDTIEMRKSI
ncbi:hypothetical protein RDABS01_034070, partial [Bienertia sinuspersici]